MSAEIGLSNLFSWIKTIPLLDRTNYSTWKMLASTALKSCGLWNIVSREYYVRPEAGRSDPDIDQMKSSDHTDAKVRFLLSMVVSDTQLRYVSHCTTSKEMWDTWSAIYGDPHDDCNDLKVQHRLYGYRAKKSAQMNENDNNKKGNVNQLRWKHEIASDQENDFQINLASVACENKRVILFFDVDCFEVQLWMKELRRDLIGKDVPVVVINSDRIILSVNYTAKSMGVKRGEGRRSLIEARLLCQKAGTKLVEIIVPERYGKANTFLPLVEGNLILKAVLSFPKFQNKLSSIKVERSCKDELYIDVTDLIQEKINSFKLATVNGNSICVPSHREINFLIQRKHHPNDKYDGTAETVMEGRKGQITGRDLRSRIQQTYHPRNIKTNHLDELRLVHGAIMAIAIIKHIRIKTGYEVSAGISHSKLLAKLACGLNKPKGISIITDISLPRLGKIIPFQELPGFGGKTGNAIRAFFLKRGQTIKSVSDVLQATNRDLNYWIKILYGIPDADTKAKDLFNTCKFKDDSVVTTTVHPDVISTMLQIKYSKDCKDSRIFKQGKMNIAQDMANRINYCKTDLGRIATELAVKVDMIKTSGPYVSPHFLRTPDLSVKLPLPQETDQFVSHESIYEFASDYITNHGFHWDKVSKIRLTAQKFLTDKEKNQTNRKFKTVYITD